jgi:putative peptide zinc metalloprotease protein
VERVARREHLLLISPTGNAMRVSATVGQCWELLEKGVRLEALIDHLQSLYPADSTAQRVTDFVNNLRAGGLLEEVAAEKKPAPVDHWAVDLDRPARIVAKALCWAPASVTVGGVAALIAALTACARVVALGTRPHFADMARKFSWSGLAICLLALIPMHELAHAVACRLAGAPAGKAVLERGGLGLPRVFLRTPGAALVESRWKRALVACSGLLTETLAGGLAAWGLLTGCGGEEVHRAELFVFLYCLMCLSTGSSPIHESDGSHTLEALFNDDSLRVAALMGRKSRFTKARDIQAYRVICVAHMLLSLVFLRYMLV